MLKQSGEDSTAGICEQVYVTNDWRFMFEEACSQKALVIFLFMSLLSIYLHTYYIYTIAMYVYIYV